MNNSIIGKLSFNNENKARLSIEYLQKIGIDLDRYRKEVINYMSFEDIYVIEFKEKPSILKALEYNNCSDKDDYIDITYISEFGISFYVVGRELGDGFIFVSMNNIKCIHTIKKDQIDRHICYEYYVHSNCHWRDL